MKPKKGKKNPREWLASGDYLPAPLRDFHDQKDVFKMIWRLCQELENEESGFNPLNGGNWVMMHIFVVDYFLKIMAACGWTLQRSRKDVDFYDLDAGIEEMKAEMTKEFQAYLDSTNNTKKEVNNG